MIHPIQVAAGIAILFVAWLFILSIQAVIQRNEQYRRWRRKRDLHNKRY